MNPTVLFVTGGLSFGAAQALWGLARAQNLVRGTWMMKTGTGIVLCMAVFLIAATIAFSLGTRRHGVSDGIVAMEAGAVLAVLVALFIIGPGSLWPAVLALDAFLIGVAIAAGAGVSTLVRRSRERSPR